MNIDNDTNIRHEMQDSLHEVLYVARDYYRCSFCWYFYKGIVAVFSALDHVDVDDLSTCSTWSQTAKSLRWQYNQPYSFSWQQLGMDWHGCYYRWWMVLAEDNPVKQRLSVSPTQSAMPNTSLPPLSPIHYTQDRLRLHALQAQGDSRWRNAKKDLSGTTNRSDSR